MFISPAIVVLTALLCIVAALALLAFWQWRRTSAKLAALEDDLRRAEVQGHEQAQRLAALESLRETSQLAEHAIATGTAVVKEVHRGIADIPFSVLEAIPGAREPAKALRGLHDSISEGIYGALGKLNKAVNQELRKGTTLPEPAQEPVSVPAPSAIPAPKLDTPPGEPDDPAPGGGKSWG